MVINANVLCERSGKNEKRGGGRVRRTGKRQREVGGKTERERNKERGWERETEVGKEWGGGARGECENVWLAEVFTHGLISDLKTTDRKSTRLNSSHL